MRKILKITSIVTATLIAVLALAVWSLKLPSVQEYIKNKALEILGDKLGTNVRLQDAGISVTKGSIALYGLSIDDRAGEPLMGMDTLYTRVDLWKAWKEKHIEIESLNLSGLTANIYKTKSDSAANFQFVIDAFKNDSTPANDRKSAFTLDLKHVSLSRIDVMWQDRSKPGKGMKVKVQSIELDNSGAIDKIVKVRGLAYATDNGKPRRNAGKPNRGAFDAGHLDLLVNADFTAHVQGKSLDSTTVTLHNAWGQDRGSGLQLDSLCLNASLTNRLVTITDIHVRSRNTTLAMDRVLLQLPDSTRTLSYKSSTVKGKTILSDISRPFAPALKKFTTPLSLSVVVSGDAHTMKFSNVTVNTPDKRLLIKANGNIVGLEKGKHKDVHFAISSMHASNGVKEQILAHFPVKQSMMGIIRSAGNITYSGNLSVPRGHVIIGGKLGTPLGKIDFTVDIDQKDKYLTGIAGTDQFAIGKLIGSTDFKDIAFSADFKFNIAGAKAARKLNRHLGKLPVGYIKGTASSATYKKLTLHNLVWDITSDGDVARGTGGMQAKVVDVMCEFSFTDTELTRSLKCKPNFKFHNIFKKGGKETAKDKNNDNTSSQDTKTEQPKKKKWQFWKK